MKNRGLNAGKRVSLKKISLLWEITDSVVNDKYLGIGDLSISCSCFMQYRLLEKLVRVIIVGTRVK